MPGLGTEFQDDAGSKPVRCDDRYLASILRSTLETLKALISGHPAFVPKLTLCGTRNAHVSCLPSRSASKSVPSTLVLFRAELGKCEEAAFVLRRSPLDHSARHDIVLLVATARPIHKHVDVGSRREPLGALSHQSEICVPGI